MFANRLTLVLLVAIAEATRASPALAQAKVVAATVCTVAKSPAPFDNKFVRLRATLEGNFEISAISDPDNRDCGSLWFTYPGSGPEAMVSMSILMPRESRPVVRLKGNRQFKRFQRFVDAKMYPRQRDSLCTGCTRYQVTAVMVGLVEYAGRGHGFGHMNGFPVQFVLQSVGRISIKDLASSYNPAEFSTTPVHFPTGYLTGTLIDPDGRSVPDADLNVYPATDKQPRVDEDSATTDAKGRFRFAVPPGAYVIGFNTFWVPSPKAPFPPTYYRSSPERSGAVLVIVGDKQHVKNLVLKIPKRLVARTVPIRVVWPDGRPVADANVWLSQVSDPTSVVGISVSHTAADGTFDLIGFEGIDYILHADKYAGFGHVSCAKNELIRASDLVPAPIQLSLSITDYGVCTNTDFEVPTDASQRRQQPKAW